MFFNFILQHRVDWELDFVGFFFFFFYGVISISWLGFGGLAKGESGYFFVLFLFDFFFQFNPSTLGGMRIRLHNYYFVFFSIKLSWFYNPGCLLSWITQVVFCVLFLIDFFFKFLLLTLILLVIELYIYYFYLFFQGLSRSHDLDLIR